MCLAEGFCPWFEKVAAGVSSTRERKNTSDANVDGNEHTSPGEIKELVDTHPVWMCAHRSTMHVFGPLALQAASCC